MKRLPLICGLLWSAVASAQFVPGQLLTAAELNSAFANTAPAPGITCLGASSALNYTSNVFSCNAAINAATLGGATFSAPGPIGSVSTSTGAFSSVTTPSATIGGGSINATTVGAISPSTGAFTTLSASSTVSGAGFTTLLGAYAPLAGATFTGPVTVSLTGATFSTNETSGTGQSGVQLKSAGSNVWALYNSTTSNFLLQRFVSGTAVDNPISVSTSTGVVTMSDGITNTPISGSTGSFTTLSSTGNFTPSQTSGIVGTTTNNNANAGSVGEYISATPAAVGLTTLTTANAASISITAGDWEVGGTAFFSTSGAGSMIAVLASSSGTSLTLAAAPLLTQFSNIAVAPGGVYTAILPMQRYSVSGTSTIYCVVEAQFTDTVTGQCNIRARRVR